MRKKITYCYSTYLCVCVKMYVYTEITATLTSARKAKQYMFDKNSNKPRL
jgi:hypothetical protein